MNDADPPRSALADAYQGTRFEVEVDGAVAVIAADAPPPDEVAAVLAAHSPATGAYLTAFNPRSEVLEAEDNRRRQAALHDWLARLGLDWLPGQGVDPSGAWASEESVLVLGVTLEDALSLAELYEQNCIVWLAAGEPARLVYTKHWDQE